MLTQYQIALPLPPSVNHYLVTDRKGRVRRSKEYQEWLTIAARYWRSQFPEPPKLLTGRLRAQYIFVFSDEIRRDIENFPKVIADWLQGKFYEDDYQIDESHSIRRVLKTNKASKVFVYITETSDERYIDMLAKDFDPAYAD